MSIDEAKKALNEYFSDKRRSAKETLDGLEELREEIDSLIDCLRCDIDREEE